jgi:hypothetical protein
VLQNNPRIAVLNDLQVKAWVLSRILNSKNYCADSLAYSKNKIYIQKKERPILLTLPLDFSPADVISILQNTTEHKRSLHTSVCSNSLTVPFPHDTDKSKGSVFFPKTNVEQISDQMKELSLFNKERGSADPQRAKII